MRFVSGVIINIVRVRLKGRGVRDRECEEGIVLQNIKSGCAVTRQKVKKFRRVDYSTKQNISTKHGIMIHFAPSFVNTL